MQTLTVKDLRYNFRKVAAWWLLKHHPLIPLLAVTLVAFFTPAVRGGEEASHDFAKFKAAVEASLNDKVTGGYAFVVLDHGQPRVSGAWGWARRPDEKSDPSVRWTTATAINVASVSKMITAAGLLRLWDETHHGFSLDDPAWIHLKPLVPSVSQEARKITIRNLLQHASCLGDGPANTPATATALLNKPLVGTPGKVKKYDNRNYYLIRLLIEATAHENYAAYVKKHVLEPMGIHGMDVKPPPAHHTIAYAALDDRNPGIDLVEDATLKGGGAGGWYGSASDMARFLGGICQQTVLSKEATDALTHGDLGWDYTNPCFAKGGDWGGSSGNSKGELHAAINLFPDDVQAVILANAHLPKAASYILNDGWYASSLTSIRMGKIHWQQEGDVIRLSGTIQNPSGKPRKDVPVEVTLFAAGNVFLKCETRIVQLAAEENAAFDLQLEAKEKVAALKVRLAGADHP